MNQRKVEFSEDARTDLVALYDWLSNAAEAKTALSYVERLETYCKGFDLASERGHARDDVRQGLRIVGFERRVTIAFMVEENRVVILRLFYGGQNWTKIIEH